MPIDYTSTTSSLQVRLGKFIGLGTDLRSQQGSTLTNINEVRAAYTATTIDREEYVGPLASDDNEELVDGMARTLQTYVRDGMERTVIKTVSSGIREVNNATDALRLLATDMIENSQAISTTAISISAQTATATGSGAFSVSAGGQYVYGGAKYTTKQTQNDSIIAETVSARCIKDARDGSLILGNERFEIQGQGAVDRLDRRWQDGTSGYGSGARVLINSTCGSIEASSIRGQNMLSNSGMERVNGTPFPLDWQIQTGTEGTNLTAENSGARGSWSMNFTGNGTVLHNVYETMGQGPRPNIKSNTVYIVSAMLATKGGTVNAGTFALQLRDASNTEISGCSVARVFNTSNLAVGSWVRLVGSFTTPLTLTSGTRFALAFTVPLGNTQVLLVDEVVLTEAAELYAGGPKMALLAGTADWELDDRINVAIAKTTDPWQVNLDRYLDLAGRGIQLPTSATTATNTWSSSLLS